MCARRLPRRERRGWPRFPTQTADLFEGDDSSSVLVQNAPRRDYVVETKFEFDLPASGNFKFQAGLLLYQGTTRS